MIEICINAIIIYLEENGLQCNTPRQNQHGGEWSTYVINPFIGIKDQLVNNPYCNRSHDDPVAWQVPHATLGEICCNINYISIQPCHTSGYEGCIIYEYCDPDLFDKILQVFQQDLQNYINPIDYSDRIVNKQWAAL